jgi:hypothetical protein
MKIISLLSALALAAPLASASPADLAPKPLYRDPVYDGAADVSIIYDRSAKLWKMFYTNRRATMKLPDPKDVAWVHGTSIGVATSPDGVHWRYAGTADLPRACTTVTSWAPEMYYENGTYHMWLTVVPGIFHRWGQPGSEARIVHLTSPDLAKWSCESTADLGPNSVIDPTVLKLGSGYRMWYKDEKFGSRIVAADSSDLRTWKRFGERPVTETRGEGPKAFRFKGHYWIVADAWKGLMVLRSDDASSWTQQDGFLFGEPGSKPTDRGIGQHPDVVISGDRAFIYYFVHQGSEPEARTDPYWRQRTVIQVAELIYKDGKLTADRNADLRFSLTPPAN